MKAIIGMVAAMLIIQPAVALAQEVPSVGHRVRVHLQGRPAVTGLVTFMNSDEVGLQMDGSDAEAGFDRSSITGLDRSLGEQRSFVKHLFLSAGVTMATSGAVSALAWKPCTDTGFMACLLHPRSRGHALGVGAVGGAILGIPIGIVVGLTRKTEKWAPVDLGPAQDTDLAILPILGPRPGVQASLSFRLF